MFIMIKASSGNVILWDTNSNYRGVNIFVEQCRHFAIVKGTGEGTMHLFFCILSSVLEDKGIFLSLVELVCWVHYHPKGMQSVLKNDISLAIVRGTITGVQLQQFQGLRKKGGAWVANATEGPNSSVSKESEELA